MSYPIVPSGSHVHERIKEQIYAVLVFICVHNHWENCCSFVEAFERFNVVHNGDGCGEGDILDLPYCCYSTRNQVFLCPDYVN